MSKVISNTKINQDDLDFATRIITDLQHELSWHTNQGHGPFLAAIYDTDGNLICKCANSVVLDKCSNNHAEMNAIREAQQLLKTYDLSGHNLSIYITSEPCMMCLGAIMWSGIRRVFYGVPSSKVEEITGFDEGFKQGWLNEFARRGIQVYGNIATKIGEQELENYISHGNTVYKPNR